MRENGYQAQKSETVEESTFGVMAVDTMDIGYKERLVEEVA